MRRRLGRNSFIYTCTTFLHRGIMFLLLPLYTRYLSPKDLGIVVVVTALTNVLVILFTLSLGGAMVRYYFEYRNDPEKLREFWGTCLTFILLVSLAGTALVMLMEPLLHPVLGEIPFLPYVLLGLLTLLFQSFFTIFLELLAVRQRATAYAIFVVSYFVLTVVLVVYLVVFRGWGAEGPLAARLAAAVFFFGVSLFAMRHDFRFVLRGQSLWEALRYSMPLVPADLAGQLQAVTDRMALNGLVSTAAVGVYNVGYMIGGALAIVSAGVNRAYVPLSMCALKTRDQTQFAALKEIGLALVVFYSLAATTVSFFSAELLMLIAGPAYRESYTVVPYIAFAFVFGGIYYLFVNILFFIPQATPYIFLTTGAGAAANIVLCLTLIPRMGYMGAALAALGGQLVLAVVVAIIGRRYERVEWQYGKMAIVVGSCLAVSLLLNHLPARGMLQVVAMKVGLLALIYLVLNLLLWRDAFFLARGILRLCFPEKDQAHLAAELRSV